MYKFPFATECAKRLNKIKTVAMEQFGWIPPLDNVNMLPLASTPSWDGVNWFLFGPTPPSDSANMTLARPIAPADNVNCSLHQLPYSDLGRSLPPLLVAMYCYRYKHVQPHNSASMLGKFYTKVSRKRHKVAQISFLAYRFVEHS